jgi:hypothetical protein
MGFFGKLFGKPDAPPPAAPATPSEDEAPPAAVVVLRQGMSVPSPPYVDQVIAAAYPEGLPAAVERFGLAQPVWFKNSEIADNAAGDVATAFAARLALADQHHTYRTLEGPDGSRVMVVELRKA